MANSSLSQLRSRVRRWIHEVDSSGSFFTDQFIDNMINAAYQRRTGQMIMAFEGAFTEAATRDIEANKSQYAWPQDFERLERLDYVTSDGTRIPINRWQAHNSVVNPTSVDPYTFRPIENGFILQPTPQEASGSLRMEYVTKVNDLLADGDTVHSDFPARFEEMLVLDTVVNLVDSQGHLEDGVPRAILRHRRDIEVEFERYIDRRVVKRSSIDPFVGHYIDA